ncbi:hypothetical protein I551_8018 [Mycobacterium ulcerans str. Harvey]|uniref:Uncharacterized protein n=1 Tax=Mycobacterium ulcerans str. Harvey TaxID=1299332 RepID=A0ABP3A7T3_MYCUL|nr:hypothetical protein I551_8018 [Mycobacterium ulcerans str. Harvey]
MCGRRGWPKAGASGVLDEVGSNGSSPGSACTAVTLAH